MCGTTARAFIRARPSLNRDLKATVGALCLVGTLFGIVSSFEMPMAAAQGRAGTETEEDALFKKAEEQFIAGDYANAAELYDQVIKLNPARVEAFVKRATLYFSEHNYDQAIQLLTRAEKLAYTDLSIKTVLGLCFYESGKKERGLSYLEEVVKQRGDTYQAQFQIGKHYVRLDPARAILALDSYLAYRPEAERPRDYAALLLLGTAYYLRGQPTEAERLLLRARDLRPRDNQIRQMLGTVYIAEGRWAEGAELYESYAHDIERRPAVAFNLATCYLKLGRKDAAYQLAKKYHALRRDDPRGLLLLAMIERASDKEADARAALQKYQKVQEELKAKPDVTTGVNIPAAIARTYLELQDVPNAIAALEPALLTLRNKPTDKGNEAYEIELTAVLLESKLKEMQKAHLPPGSPAALANLLPLAARLAELAHNDAAALALAGSAAYAAGNFDRARRYYSDARALDDRLPRARVGLSRTLEQLALAEVVTSEEKDKSGKAHAAASDTRTAAFNHALALLRESQTLDDSPSVIRNLATVYLMQGHPAEAERVLLPLLASGRGDSLAWRLHARAARMLGQAGPAAEAAERAVAEAKRQLDALQEADGIRKSGAAQRLAEAQVDAGISYLSIGEDTHEKLEKATDLLSQAVKALAATREAKDILKAAQRDLAIAYLRRGRLRLFETETQVGKNGANAATLKMAEEALADLEAALASGALESTNREIGQALCLSTLAAVHANQIKKARELAIKANAANCELNKPFNKLGTELLSAFVATRSAAVPVLREQLLRTLPRLQSRATSGPDSAALVSILRALLYSTNMALAYEYHIAGRPKLVAQSLRAAQKAQPQGEDADPVLEHNLAVLELNEGKGGGEKVLEKLAPRPPESLVNLGILQDRRSQPRKALEFYKKALERGARMPRLREWIDTKERLLGQGEKNP